MPWEMEGKFSAPLSENWRFLECNARGITIRSLFLATKNRKGKEAQFSNRVFSPGAT